MRDNESIDASPRLVIVIAGPIASGKSTLARAVAREFEQRQLASAAIDLDLVYEMLTAPGEPKSDVAVWSRARRIAAALTDALLDEGVSVVITEGNFLHDGARSEFVSALRSDLEVRFVTLTVALSTALTRAAADPTRGFSRDPAFLARHYGRVANIAHIGQDNDLFLDTGGLTVEQATELIVERFG